MPYERHEVVVAVVCGDESRDAIVAFRETMPEQVQSLLIGPVEGMNAYYSFALMPDGAGEFSNSLSPIVDEWRAKFLALMPSLLGDWIHVHMTEQDGTWLDDQGKERAFVPRIVTWGSHQDFDTDEPERLADKGSASDGKRS